MKIFLLSFVILSMTCGLNARCVKQHPNDKCDERIFPEPESKEIHYIYHGESCDCPKYHDTIVEQPVVMKERQPNVNYRYDVILPVEKKQDETRYLFDVRVEKPVVKAPERSSMSINYAIQKPQLPRQQESPRYTYDTRVEQPVKPCNDKPWQGLVAQVDRVLMPSQGCKNTEHTPETCNCGCIDASHTPATCTCGNSDYNLPIYYNTNSRYDLNADDSQISQIFTFPDSMTLPLAYEGGSVKSKREIVTEKNQKSKRRETKSQKLRKMSSKDLKSLMSIDPVVKQRSSLKLAKIGTDQTRSKRRPGSPCGYTYESCDPKKHNRQGCPLCYKCKCEPTNMQTEGASFSPYDIRVPYTVVTQEGAPGMAATNQEFDYGPAAYTGMKDRNMYKKYIQQVVSKYPEHMSRKMPEVMEQEQDLLKFIGELSKSNKSPGDEIQTEDIRYKLVDNAMDLYKYYERAMNKMPKIQIGSKNGKGFKKRGTVLEVIELDPNEFNGSYKIADEDFGQNASESQ